MSLTNFTASPLIVGIKGEPYLVRPLTVGDYGAILGNAPSNDDGSEPQFGSDAVAGWLFGDGLPYILYATIRRDRPAFTLDDAIALSVNIDSDTASLVGAVALRRLPSKATSAESGGVDLASIGWKGIFKRMADEFHFTPSQVCDMTLDQVYALVVSEDDPMAYTPKGTPMTKDEVDAFYQDYLAKEAAEKAANQTEVKLSDLGLEFVNPEDALTVSPTGE